MRTGKLLIGLALIAATPAFAQDAELTAKEQAVQVVTARPATWAARHKEFRTWLASATDEQGKPLDAAARAGHITDQIHTLDKELARAAAIKPATSDAAAIGDICLSAWLKMGCTVPRSGILRGKDGTRIVWQLQSGSSEEDGIGMGVMLWDATRAGAPRPIGWTFEGVWMDAPVYDSERQLLWVKGSMAGTGDGNADILYQKRAGKWVEIDLGSWQADLAKRLPKGLGAWHGVDYDLTSLAAETELWKDSDANCCASGGRANLDFEIEGDTLKLKAISAQIGGLDSEWKDF